MTPSTSEIVSGIYGAWRLARVDPRGLTYFDASDEGFWKSFFAAVLVLPGIAVLFLLGIWTNGAPVGLLRALSIEAIGYVAFWAAFPLVMYYLSQALDLAERYRLHIVAYNWSQVIQIAVQVPILAAILLSDQAQTPLGATIQFAIILAVIAYEAYIAHAALKLPRSGAIGIAMLSFVIAYMLQSTSFSLQNPG